ncbi:MAG: hypothetical protein P1U75_02900 [Antarcticimicrobium sp.]|uniref:hypothetical protein n=1 Tax=Antarcticimicrobium sp. TaxID=2824147 RepID=UPI00263279EA|nr:hypothetical protein [Antarcticimicrobium sp.]MDF1715612.1 hypothetical protein [Antarcticimicrobium sp.]
MVYVMPLLCFVIPLILGVVAVRNRVGWVVPLAALLLAMLMVWAIWTGRQHQGWDAIGYGIFAALMAAPAILGVLIGGGIGWWRRWRRAARGDG